MALDAGDLDYLVYAASEELPFAGLVAAWAVAVDHDVDVAQPFECLA